MNTFRVLVLVVAGIGSFLGSAAVIYRTAVRPLARALKELRKDLDLLQELANDVRDLTGTFSRYVSTTERRFETLEAKIRPAAGRHAREGNPT